MDVRVSVPDHGNVALEVRDVYRVEADDGAVRPEIEAEHDSTRTSERSAKMRLYSRVKPDISLSQAATDKEFASIAEDLLNTVQAGEKRADVLFVRLLGCRETRLVHSIVDCVVDPLVDAVDFPAQLLRVKGKPTQRGVDEIVECG